MLVSHNAVVSIHYTLTNDQGETLDSSAGGEPLTYMQGNGNLIPGLESQLEGKQAGDKLVAKVAAADAYGEYNKALVQKVPRRSFRGVANINVGMQFQVQADGGVRMVTVTQVQGDMVTVDGNHALAGQDLTFDVEITEVRAATEEEIAHGHVHGPGGHHH